MPKRKQMDYIQLSVCPTIPEFLFHGQFSSDSRAWIFPSYMLCDDGKHIGDFAFVCILVRLFEHVMQI